MSSFTMPLKEAIEYAADMGQTIGLDAYPIFDEGYRAGLNTKIVQHYWNREIGMETVELFTFALRRKMNEIMPYYNKMLESERIKFDPLSTFDMNTVATGLSQNNGSVSSNSNTFSDNVAKAISAASDFPQTALNENTTGNYVSSSNESETDAKSTAGATESNTSKSKNEELNNSRTTGYSGSAADLLTRYRGTLLNIDLAIIQDLQELFMSVWDNSDSYFENGFYL